MLFRDPHWLLLSMVGVGFAWASILLPYALLPADSVPSAGKMGDYMGIFNFFIVIPQLVAVSDAGLLVKSLFGNQPIYALLIGGASSVLAGPVRAARPEPPRHRHERNGFAVRSIPQEKHGARRIRENT